MGNILTKSGINIASAMKRDLLVIWQVLFFQAGDFKSLHKESGINCGDYSRPR